MRLRRIVAVVALATAVTVPVGSAAAMAATKPSSGPSSSAGKPVKPSKPVKPAEPSKPAKPAEPAKPAKPAKPAEPAKPAKVKFNASGTVTAVDAAGGTVTIAVKAGTKDVRGRTVTVVAPSTARIVVNKARRKLADIGVGFRITVAGTSTGSVYTAAKMEARGKKAKHVPTPTVPPGPSEEPTPESPGPSEEPTPESPAPSEPSEMPEA